MSTENLIDNKIQTKKESRTLYNKKYYDSHKEKIYEHLYERIPCDVCQKDIIRYCMSKHRKSLRHLKKQSDLIALNKLEL